MNLFLLSSMWETEEADGKILLPPTLTPGSAAGVQYMPLFRGILSVGIETGMWEVNY